MAVALPGAYGSSGLQFAGAYLAVNLWALAIQGWGLWREPATRAAWLRYVPLAALAPWCCSPARFLPEGARVVVWCAVAVFNVASALAGGEGRRGKSGVGDRPRALHRTARAVRDHLAGRDPRGGRRRGRRGRPRPRPSAPACSPPSPSPASSGGPTSRSSPRPVERPCAARPRTTGDCRPQPLHLRPLPDRLRPRPLRRGRQACRRAPDRPPSDGSDLVVLAGAVAFFVGGLLGLQWQAMHRLAPERVAAIVGVAALCGRSGRASPARRCSPWSPSSSRSCRRSRCAATIGCSPSRRGARPAERARRRRAPAARYATRLRQGVERG